MDTPEIFELKRYPMGPNVRRFMGIADADYCGDSAKTPSETVRQQFRQHLFSAIDEQPAPSAESLVDLIEEITAMGDFDAALKISESNPEIFPKDDASAWIALGNAAIFGGEYMLAEQTFREAQLLDPNEIIPYVNLGQLLFADNRDDEAKIWVEQGFSIDINNNKLWVTYAKILRVEFGENFAAELKTRAEGWRSWAGECMALEQISPGAAEFRLDILSTYYRDGERSGDFLVEYTGTLGQLGRFPEILPIVAEQVMLTVNPDDLPWQLYANDLQANLALGDFVAARKHITKLSATKTISISALAQLKEMIDEHERDSTN